MPHSPSPEPRVRVHKREVDSDSDSDDTKPHPTPRKKAKAKASPGKAAPRVWTGAELDTLFTIALAHGASKANFEGKIANRTGLQCLKTWE